jgi:Na+/melibiose symporter-like transporter
MEDKKIIDKNMEENNEGLSLLKKVLPLILALILAILLFVFFEKKSKNNQQNIEQVTKTETIDSSKMIQISDSTLEINNSDSTIIK